VNNRAEAHVLTPGDHFSPRTGSAVPTVVHGLSSAAPEPPTVLVAAGTYPERYESAVVTEYPMRRPRRWDRYVDAALSRTGLPRLGARASYRAALSPQSSLPPSAMLVHNAVQALPQVDSGRHVPILYAHNELLRTYGPRETRRTVGRSAGVIAVSEHLAARFEGLVPHGVAVEVVHNGVDTGEFEPVQDWERSDQLRVVTVGRTIPAKGVHVLLDALRVLGRDDVVVEVIGRNGFSATDPLTPYERQLRHLAREVPGRVVFSSFLERTDVADALRHADVAVVPSTWPEPSGLVVLEGMACGAATVASAVGGIPEQAGDAAFLVPPDDPRAIADVLGHLADDAQALRRARQAAREHALRRTWHHSRAELDTALDRLI